jgi:hypothetical protein
MGSYPAEMVGSNPVEGMDVCHHISVLCCPVGRGLCEWLISRSKESFQVSKYKIRNFQCVRWLRSLQGLRSHREDRDRLDHEVNVIRDYVF